MVAGTMILLLVAILLHYRRTNDAPTRITVVRKCTTTGMSRPTPTAYSRRPWINARASGHDSRSYRCPFRRRTSNMASSLLAASASFRRNCCQRKVVSRRTWRQRRSRSVTTNLALVLALDTRQDVDVGFDPIGDAVQNRGPVFKGASAPSGCGGLGCANGRVYVGGLASGQGREQHSCGRVPALQVLSGRGWLAVDPIRRGALHQPGHAGHSGAQSARY